MGSILYLLQMWHNVIAMAKQCPVCEHEHVQTINLRIVEGIPPMQLAADYGLQKAQIERHRRLAHANRAINQAILQAGQSGILSPIAAVSISSKAERLGKLQELFDICLHHIRKDHAQDLINHKLVGVAAQLLKHSAEEMGEWRPDGGQQAAATAKLAQSIIIHARSTPALPPAVDADIIEG